MAKVSILIPSRNERFLASTVGDILMHARGDIEVIVVLDGAWASPPVPEDPRVKTIHFGESKGMRPAINAAAAMATGEYLLKCDGHVSFSEGFDVALQQQCDDDWIVIPRRDRLDAERWCRQDVGKPPIDAHYLSYPYERPHELDCGLHGTVWTERAKARAHVLVDDEMSSQGSCWFMARTHWARLGPMEIEKYGNFIQEFQEIGLKTWLGGGRVVVNKNVTYLHLHKGAKYGRGYSLKGSNHIEGAQFCTDYWMNNRWPARVHNLRWLVEKFSPVPTWPADLDVVWPRGRDQVAVAAAAPPPPPPPVIPAAPPSILAPAAVAPGPAPTIDKRAPAAFADRVRRGFKRAHLAELLNRQGYRTGAEVGVADGRFSEVLCKAIPGVKLRCVDPWLRYDDNPRGGGQAQQSGNYALAQARLAPYAATLVQAMSMDAVRDVAIGSLDFVYIDGHHSFDWVMQDLIEWSRRVRSGGIVAGHDFYHFKWAGVVEAVSAYTAAHGITDWQVCEEREPSFWWIKP